MIKRAFLTIVFAVGCLLLFAQDPAEIAEKAAGVIEFDALEMLTTLNIHDHRGNVRIRQVAIATRKFGEATKTLIRFTAPADVRGTGMLVYDYADRGDDMWIYMPAMRRTRRIVSSERSGSFMGSEFINADMGGRDTDDYFYTLSGSATIEGRACWVVESVPKTQEMKQDNGYSRMVVYIDKENFHTYKTEYYDLDNRLHRVMTIGDYRRQTEGKYFAFRMEVVNVQNNRRSELNVDRFQPGSDMDESRFTVSALENF